MASSSWHTITLPAGITGKLNAGELIFRSSAGESHQFFIQLDNKSIFSVTERADGNFEVKGIPGTVGEQFGTQVFSGSDYVQFALSDRVAEPGAFTSLVTMAGHLLSGSSVAPDGSITGTGFAQPIFARDGHLETPTVFFTSVSEWSFTPSPASASAEVADAPVADYGRAAHHAEFTADLVGIHEQPALWA